MDGMQRLHFLAYKKVQGSVHLDMVNIAPILHELTARHSEESIHMFYGRQIYWLLLEKEEDQISREVLDTLGVHIGQNWTLDFWHQGIRAVEECCSLFLGIPINKPGDVRSETNVRQVIGPIQLLVDERHSFNAALAILENLSHIRVVNGTGLQIKQAANYLQVVFYAMMQLFEQDFFFCKGRL